MFCHVSFSFRFSGIAYRLFAKSAGKYEMKKSSLSMYLQSKKQKQVVTYYNPLPVASSK